MLDGRSVSREGVAYTYSKDINVILFEISDKVNSTERVTWHMNTTHSTATEGATINCVAQYSTGMGNFITSNIIFNEQIL